MRTSTKVSPTGILYKGCSDYWQAIIRASTRKSKAVEVNHKQRQLDGWVFQGNLQFPEEPGKFNTQGSREPFGKEWGQSKSTVYNPNQDKKLKAVAQPGTEISTQACEHLVLPLTSYSCFSLTDYIGGTVAGRHSPLLVPSLNMYIRLPFLFSPHFLPPSLFPHSPLSYCYIMQSPETYLVYDIWVHFFPSSFQFTINHNFHVFSPTSLCSRCFHSSVHPSPPI